METFEEKVMKQFAEMNTKFIEQAQKMEAIQAKVDLSMSSLGQVQQDQAQLVRSFSKPPPPPPPPPQFTRPPPLTIPAKDGPGLMGAKPGAAPFPPSSSTNSIVMFLAPTPQVQSVPSSPSFAHAGNLDPSEGSSRNHWMPKLDFPRFDGTYVRIWLDKCQSFFNLYQIPHGFKVQAASMHLTDSAAHWYQSFKLLNPYHDWDIFKVAVLDEFEVNTHRNKLMELLSVKQLGTVEEYKKKFEQLMYHVRLYDSTLSETLLVTQFVLGLKDDIRASVESQCPETVSKAAQLALIQEHILDRQKKNHPSKVRLLSSLLAPRLITNLPCNQGSFGRQNSSMNTKELMDYVISVGTNSVMGIKALLPILK